MSSQHTCKYPLRSLSKPKEAGSDDCSSSKGHHKPKRRKKSSKSNHWKKPPVMEEFEREDQRDLKEVGKRARPFIPKDAKMLSPGGRTLLRVLRSTMPAIAVRMYASMFFMF